MVATRRSTGGQAAPEAANLSKAQLAALKKLKIAGTDALKGDKKAVEAAKQTLETYHYRGASYAKDERTKPEWIEGSATKNRRSSRASTADAAAGVEESTREEEEPPTKRRRREDVSSQPPQGRSAPKTPTTGVATAPQNTTTAASKRKAASLDDEEQLMPPPKRRASTMKRDSMSNTKASVTEDDRQNERRPNLKRKRTGETERRHVSDIGPAPKPKVSLSDNESIVDEIERRRRQAIRQREAIENASKLQTQPLRDEDMLSEAEIIQRGALEWARIRKVLQEKMEEHAQSTELFQRYKRAEAMKKATKAQENRAGASTTKHADADDAAAYGQRDEDVITAQWEREQGHADEEQDEVKDSEQEQEPYRSSPQNTNSASNESVDIDPEQARSLPQSIQATSGGSEIPETPSVTDEASEARDPTPSTEHKLARPTTESHQDQAVAGAPRPQTHSTNTERPSTSSKLPRPVSRGYTPVGNTTTSAHTITPTSASGRSSSVESKVNFRELQPDSVLPLKGAGGHKVRWSIEKRQAAEGGRAEYAIDIARLDGESKAARARRVRREREIVEGWAKMTGGKVVEKSQTQ